jgi:hypothetical protein
MYAELKENLLPYRSIDVHTNEGCFNLQYQRRKPDLEYVSVQGKTVASAKGSSRSIFNFAIGSLPATLEVRPRLFRQLATLTLTVDNQTIYAEKLFKQLLPDRWWGILFMAFWYLGIYCILGLILQLILRACRWILDSFLDFNLGLKTPFNFIIAFVLFLWLPTLIWLVKGVNRVAPESLIRKIDNPDELSFERMHAEWERFKSKMVEGDEIWEWQSPEVSWRVMAGRCGYVIVHQGHPTQHILITGMS